MLRFANVLLTALNLTADDREWISSTRLILRSGGTGVGVFWADFKELTVSDHVLDFSSLISVIELKMVLKVMKRQATQNT